MLAALGVLAIALADALSRATRSSSQGLFWAGLLLIFVPIAVRLVSHRAGRNERIALVLLLGCALYLVKAIRDPFGFTFADELAHLPNAQAILASHHLFGENPLLPVTPRYPGLESITAALSSLTGLSAFGSGLVVIGVARVAMMLALFLLFERLTGSPRAAGIAAAVYAANPNFVFFDAQFSYESLALPLFVLCLYAYTEWRRDSTGVGWAAVILLTTTAVVATHHVTSYALLLVLLALTVIALIRRRGPLSRVPWLFAAFAVAATAAWAALVARPTYQYLEPVLRRAVTSTVDTVAGRSGTRTPFVTSGGTVASPLAERVVGILAVAVLVVALPFGLRIFWRRYRSDPLAILLSIAAVVYVGVLGLRLVPSAWETANRSGEFLFLGVGFVLALAALERRSVGVGALVAMGALAVLFAGGVIMGWSPDQRLAHPYHILAGSRGLDSDGRQLASWARSNLGDKPRMAASESDARLLDSYANAFAIAGSNPDVRDLLQTTSLPAWQRKLLRENRLQYVVVDRRLRSFDNIAGYFFGSTLPGKRDRLLPRGVGGKFDRAGADRLYDSGAIRVYDVRGVSR